MSMIIHPMMITMMLNNHQWCSQQPQWRNVQLLRCFHRGFWVVIVGIIIVLIDYHHCQHKIIIHFHRGSWVVIVVVIFIVIYLYHHLPGILSFLCHLQKNCLIPHFINHPHHLHQSYYYSNIFPLNLPDVVLLTFTSIKCVRVVVCCGTCQLKEENFYILDIFFW